jgi:hypothetical protein
MRVFRVHQRSIGALAAWLLIAQALAAGHMPMREAVSIKDPVLGELVMCSSRAPGQETNQPPPKSQHKAQCPCCMTGCTSGSAPAAMPVALRTIAIVQASTVATFPAAFETPANYVRLATTHPRGPPALLG